MTSLVQDLDQRGVSPVPGRTSGPAIVAGPGHSAASDVWRPVTGTFTWLLLLFVTGLWLASGALASVDSPAAALTSLGRFTGLVASALLLLQVLLMARIPPVERAFGQDTLARAHALVGFGSFTLMLAHVLLILAGYSGAEPSALWRTRIDTVTGEPGMILALLGTIGLCLVVVSSWSVIRRRLRYESWHLLHLYAYLGVFLALPHQLWTGTSFASSTAATVFWWTAWAAAAGAVLAFRIGLPVVRNLRHRLVVSQVLPLGDGVTRVTVTGRDLHRLPVRAGQFFQWRFLGRPGWTRANPYSICSAPDGRSLQIAVAAAGDGSADVAMLAPGTRVWVEGPYGRLHSGMRSRRRTVLIGAGIGIAPLKALLEDLPQQPGDVTVLYRAGDGSRAPLLAEVSEAARRRGASLVLLAGHRPVHRVSWLPEAWAHLDDADALRYLVPDIAAADVYVCGSPDWMKTVERALDAAGVSPALRHTERFAY